MEEYTKMDTLFLYEFKTEDEDDPYCAHWYNTDFQTHSYDKLNEKVLELKRKELHKPDLSIHELVDGVKDVNGFFFGFVEVKAYDYIKGEYVLDHTEYLSREQIGYDCIDFSSFDREFKDFFHDKTVNSADGIISKTFNFPIKAKFLDGTNIDTSFDFTLKKRDVSGGCDHWIILVEGGNEENFLSGNTKNPDGTFDLSENWHISGDDDILHFGRNIVSWWDSGTKEVFKHKFRKAVGKK